MSRFGSLSGCVKLFWQLEEGAAPSGALAPSGTVILRELATEGSTVPRQELWVFLVP